MQAEHLAAAVELMHELIPNDSRRALAQDPETSIPLLFPPLSLRALSSSVDGLPEECSCDGYYEAELLPDRPIIIYRRDVSSRRVRFTLLHELGHHLIRSVEPDLLDVIDDLAGRRHAPDDVEERACHEFAGQLLVPTAAMDDVIGQGAPSPDHVAELYRRCRSSWEATAMRVASRLKGEAAVVLVRDRGRISFAASAPGLVGWWSRGSPSQPGGPLSMAVDRPATAAEDVFRWDLPGATRLWCDVRQPYDGLGVAVLTDRPSRPRLNILTPVSREWGRLYCERCGELREGEWCYECRGAACEHCQACGCWRRPKERLCEGPCGLLKGPGAFRPGEGVCKDCSDA